MGNPELGPEVLNALRLTGRRLCSAGERELADLLEGIERVKKNIKSLQPESTEPGTGTTEETSNLESP